MLGRGGCSLFLGQLDQGLVGNAESSRVNRPKGKAKLVPKVGRCCKFLEGEKVVYLRRVCSANRTCEKLASSICNCKDEVQGKLTGLLSEGTTLSSPPFFFPPCAASFSQFLWADTACTGDDLRDAYSLGATDCVSGFPPFGHLFYSGLAGLRYLLEKNF